ncbi:flagellar basal body-associated FliL family protein [Vibrio diazotrophicus]|uniref:Flagellar protein FliL n=1 Tax=Vibrio diazotrophicus TaxID=685 RepID=A0A329EAK4_VIBDI|nr:flagellar basal body-associated FliL family protein [Vibrio diazotrophicus]PNH78833.1 flagellar protein [Vibrio diazotrophicus]PNH95457.1 flagellar protein [Vibrio diazotrophicus]PNI02091.1 flagellar protein [Vibrio diazotrophicus]RAS62830.1 flagellar FliL protein [Vibrio diazotrophicus]
MSKKQIITMFIMLLVTNMLVTGGIVFGGIMYLKSPNNGESNSWFAQSPLSFLTYNSQEGAQAPSFRSLEKVVLSIKGEKQNHFLMLEIAVETRYPEAIENINDYMPVVHNSMIKLFSDKTYEDIQQDGIIDKLQNEVKQSVLSAFDKTDILHNIDDVLLTKFVVQ